MQTCDNCNASNTDASRYCAECGKALVRLESVSDNRTGTPEERKIGATLFADAVSAKSSQLMGHRQADIMFVLDCTASMKGELNAIRDAILDFTRTIETEGVRVRVGLVAFRDRLIKQEHRILLFDGQPFTTDCDAFSREVAKLEPAGGGDNGGESGLDAMMLALDQPFDPARTKVVVLVTDEPPHIPDRATQSMEEVCDRISEVGIAQMYLVMRTEDPASLVYLKLLESRGVKGTTFELGRGDDFRARAEHFKRNLMAMGKTINGLTD